MVVAFTKGQFTFRMYVRGFRLSVGSGSVRSLYNYCNTITIVS